MTTAQTEARAVAPDRIWVTGSFHMGAYVSGSWNVQKLSNSRTDLGELEYVRADLHAGVLTTKDAELAALKKQIEELTAALEPFARYATESGFGCDNHGNPLPDASGVGWIYLTNGDFRRARAALASTRETSDAG